MLSMRLFGVGSLLSLLSTPYWRLKVDMVVLLLRSSLESYKPFEPEREYSPKEMEYYDSLSFRFEKAVELFLSFFKTLEIYLFGEQSDTLRNRLLRLQKAGYLDSVDFWMSARILRNKIAHAYLPEELREIYQDIVRFGQEIVNSTEKLKEKLKEENIIT